MRSPLVSIVTPSYNQGDFIGETLQSVRQQEYDSIEHIVVDGASTDYTLQTLSEYEGTYDLQWVSEPDEGQAAALQKGFEMASGDIVCWLNSDDIYLSDTTISRVVESFDTYRNIDVVSGQGVIISSDGEWLRVKSRPDHKVSAKHMKYGHTILQPATFWRSEVSDSIELDTSLRYAFDWDYFIRMFEQYNVLPINDCIAGYRMWGENKTASGGADRARELQEVTGRYLGQRSWQYQILGLFCNLYRLGETLPTPLGTSITKSTRLLSTILRRMTYGRITGVG